MNKSAESVVDLEAEGGLLAKVVMNGSFMVQLIVSLIATGR